MFAMAILKKTRMSAFARKYEFLPCWDKEKLRIEEMPFCK